MHSFVNIERFSTLISWYDTYFFDLWGTIYDGLAIFPEFLVILNELRHQKKTIRFLSNSPRRSFISQRRLADCGLHVDVNEIVTSGEYFAHLLSNTDYNNSKFFLIGNDKTVVDDLNIIISDDLNTANYLLISLCEQTKDLAQWQSIMIEAISKGIQAVCINPDLEVFQGQTKIYTPGYYALQYEKLGGEVIYFGKPYKDVYDFILSSLKSSGKVLAVGDSLNTDIKGACIAKIDSLLVLGRGIHKEIKISDKMQVLHLCQQHKCYPNYIMDELAL